MGDREVKADFSAEETGGTCKVDTGKGRRDGDEEENESKDVERT